MSRAEQSSLLPTTIQAYHSEQVSQIKLVSSNTGASHLTNLPSELHLQIFKLLDNVTSTCLGLTCRPFYEIHQHRHGPVPLCRFTRYLTEYIQLGQLLLSWAGPDFVFNKTKPYIFVKKDRYDAFLWEIHVEQERQDIVVRRLTEQDFINAEASIINSEISARRRGTDMALIEQRKKTWRSWWEKAVNAGFDFTWMYMPQEGEPITS